MADLSLSFSEDSTRPNPFRKPEPVTTDAELLIRQAFQAEVRKGYELLFRRYYRVLCSQAVRFVYSRDIAQDIVGEVFLNFWKTQAHLHITTSYRAYLFTAVRNRVYNHLQDELRKDNLLGKQTDTFEEPPADDDPQQMLQFTELYNRIEEEIRVLPPQCQRVFLLSRFEGRKNREIADELQISIKTVEAHMFRALSHLRRALQIGLMTLLSLLIAS
ncbi:RNA polymerase sigma-70 factor [Nibrella saemangeumensis]|uniref:RNA polymerase sigma-70 factor n=1 Tax=Nibrella saemangeumensis TaxID=1084526 RepID=A0ABP8N6K3_9BACT